MSAPPLLIEELSKDVKSATLKRHGSRDLSMTNKTKQNKLPCFIDRTPSHSIGAFTLDVKSMLNENLGGILGGTQC